jgi:hypothetical protein
MDCSGETSGQLPTKVSLTTLMGDSIASFPMLNNLWTVFSAKGIRTSLLSIGCSETAIADLSIAETLGCPLHIVALSPKEEAQWKEVAVILKERKRVEPNTAFPFSEGAQTKWILPKNLRIQPTVPWWTRGTIVLGDTTLQAEPVDEMIARICQEMKVKNNEVRLDILKIDTTENAPGLEQSILGAVLAAGFRPGLITVRWTKMPDTDLPTTIAAGHLQNCGYRLLDKHEDKFLYYFSDEDLYQICSWETTKVANPITTEIMNVTRESIRASLSQQAAAAKETPAQPEPNSSTITEEARA